MSPDLSKPYGATITLPKEWGVILVAFLALFVKLASDHLWGIFSFAIFQFKATQTPQDDVYHQVQVVLRNVGSSTALLWELVTTAFARKGAKVQTFRRIALLLLLASIHAVGFYIASGLVSQFVAAKEDIVLVNTKACGWQADPMLTNLDNDETFEAANALVVMARSGYRRAASYARACYGKFDENSTPCNIYANETINYKTTRDVQCPFGDNICKGSGIAFDTGYMDSRLLGLNTKKEDSVSIRKTLMCTPIDDERFTTGFHDLPQEVSRPLGINEAMSIIEYKFGRNPEMGELFDKDNTTFVLTNLTVEYRDTPYSLSWVTDFPYTNRPDQTTLFMPVPALASNASDLYLIGLMNKVYYREPVRDPLFRATTESKGVNSFGLPDFYGADKKRPFSFVGCRESYEFCTASANGGRQCSDQLSLYALENNTALELTPPQEAAYSLLWKILWGGQLNFVLGLTGKEILVANNYLWDGGFDLGLSANLPDNQWEKEAENWMNTTLAYMQGSFVTFARPSEFQVGSGISSLKHIVAPTDPEIKQLCGKILAKSQAHMSFSSLYMGLTIALSSLVVIINSFLSSITASIQKKRGLGLYKRLEWIETGKLQLQRMAAEGRGFGPWVGLDQNIPQMRNRKQLFNLTEHSLTQVKQGRELDEGSLWMAGSPVQGDTKSGYMSVNSHVA
ncbi:hypothetical protein EJ04DRAFT_563373 [Polyplosphaeria fusca]|uniref:Uncharacterized protein n=1 Tax=Polyplosphaeria fusca TaxID=682080 RepID=A0A9P4R2B1_9PLEO|nr:hypothetical protein EJ04DRAFT_563373 [Polyplosphaeria fusca]